jgi:hypothetical protein
LLSPRPIRVSHRLVRGTRASSNSESATVALRHFPQIDRLSLDAHLETLP